jgi:hypothetical protein
MPGFSRRLLAAFALAMFAGCPTPPPAEQDCSENPFQDKCPLECDRLVQDPRCVEFCGDGEVSPNFEEKDCQIRFCVLNPGDIRCAPNPHVDGGGPDDEGVGLAPVEYCDGFDNDGDSLVDEADPFGVPCPCGGAEDQQFCYSGPPGTRGVGTCAEGVQLCISTLGFDTWGECQNQRLPIAEVCDFNSDPEDEDCDGIADNGCIEGGPQVTCPGNLLAAPLQTRQLTATAQPGASGAAIQSVFWSILNRPATSSTNPSPANALTTSIFLDVAGSFDLKFTAVDTNGTPGSCNVNINAIPTENLRIEVSWNSDGTDVDSHLLDITATKWGGDEDDLDCNFRNCDGGSNLEWGVAGAADNPRLDIDDTNGFGPENINIDFPRTGGAYRFGTQYFRSSGNTNTQVLVRIFCGGTLGGQFTLPVLLDQQLWKVADVSFSNQTTCLLTELGQVVGFTNGQFGAGIPR